jgi:predicted DNA-binding transcriptional regulator AlpA
MNGDKLLTVKEFAAITGVSVQSVYKKISNSTHSIQRFIVELNGVKMVKPEAVEWYQAQKEESNQSSSSSGAPEVVDQSIIEILKQQIELLNNQIVEKDKQIESLLEQLRSVTKVVDQQQQLTALNQKLMIPEQATGDQSKRRWWNRRKKHDNNRG